MLWRTLGLILMLAATDAHAGSSALSGDDIKQTVAGAVFAVDTPLGSTLPIAYGEDGRMSAEAGALAYLLGSPTDSGSWWISGNRLCQKWRRWFDGAVHCLRLSQEGRQVFGGVMMGNREPHVSSLALSARSASRRTLGSSKPEPAIPRSLCRPRHRRCRQPHRLRAR